MSGKNYFHELAPARVAMHNRYRARFHFKMLSQRHAHRIIGTPIFRRLANFNYERAICGRSHTNLLCSRHNFNWKAHR